MKQNIDIGFRYNYKALNSNTCIQYVVFGMYFQTPIALNSGNLWDDFDLKRITGKRILQVARHVKGKAGMVVDTIEHDHLQEKFENDYMRKPEFQEYSFPITEKLITLDEASEMVGKESVAKFDEYELQKALGSVH